MNRTEAFDLATRLDGMDCEVTDWEADFLESMLKLEGDPSSKQAGKLRSMEKKYERMGDL